jgi:NAD(P)-dependent dehydrogenase (short-subunit alcohol dehydrogenase family)
MGAYGQSKLANLLFTYELQRRLLGTKTIAVAAHPGWARTALGRNMPSLLAAASAVMGPLVKNAAKGALPTVRAATDPGVLGGQYYGPGGFGGERGNPKIVASSAQSHDVELQRQLWQVSEALTSVVYSVG